MEFVQFTKPIRLLTLMLTLVLVLGMNGANEINAFLSKIKASVDARCEYTLKNSLQAQ